jgi:D-hydroxyproline dehydrogenase subunit gamma
MPTKARFRLLAGVGDSHSVRFKFDGRTITSPPGITVAAALLAAGVTVFRTTPVGGTPRAPYCMMGACFDCLVEIDGIPNRQSCLVPVREAMDVRTQVALRAIGAEQESSHAD